MPQEYDTVLHRWFDQVWNQQRTDTIDELMTDDTRHYGLSGPGGEPVTGLDNFKAFHKTFLAAFPDLHVTVDDVVSEGSKISGRYTVTGINRGPLNDQDPTHVKVEFAGFGMCTMESGKFVEVWNYVDFPKMQNDLQTGEPEEE